MAVEVNRGGVGCRNRENLAAVLAEYPVAVSCYRSLLFSCFASTQAWNCSLNPGFGTMGADAGSSILLALTCGEVFLTSAGDFTTSVKPFLTYTGFLHDVCKSLLDVQKFSSRRAQKSF